jgi:xylan 1,4-beta-xylosidase
VVAVAITSALYAAEWHNNSSSRMDTFAVQIAVDVSKPTGDMPPVWRFFGCDEPNYATMKNGRKLMASLTKLGPQQVFFRTHNLLTSGDGSASLKWGSTNIYTEDADGRPIYDWKIIDGIFDSYRKQGIRPYVQVGFMPEALSIHPKPYRHNFPKSLFTGWAYPPKDYGKWGEAVYEWAKHCVERYGRAEVEHWYWEVWNEPNIGYWKSTPEEFYKLHDYAVDGILRALPTARVGGPDVAGYGGRFMEGFIEHCLHGTNFATGQPGTKLDFISFHAKGSPSYVDGHVRMGIANQLREFDHGFGLVASIRELKSKPIIVGESDPDGCAACQGPQLGYRTGTMYSSYTAASIAREYELMDRHGVNFEGSLTWAFEFEDQPWFAGFRALATNGVDLPVLNVFRMLGKMGGHRVQVESSAHVSLESILKDGVREAPDVSGLASRDDRRVTILVWHYHDDDIPGPDAQVSMNLTGLPNRSVRVRSYRIDQDHSNAYTAWQRMGSPKEPTADQISELEKAGKLAERIPSRRLKVDGGVATLDFVLPRQGVELVEVAW